MWWREGSLVNKRMRRASRQRFSRPVATAVTSTFGIAYGTLPFALSLVIALTTASHVSAGPISGNLLINPGAETGDMTGWTSVVLGFNAIDYPLGLGEDTIDKTEGDWYFARYQSGGTGSNITAYIWQRVDVSTYALDSGIVEATFGGDSMGATTRSSPGGSTNARYNLNFYNESDALISSTGWYWAMSQSASPESTLDFRQTAAVPAETVYINFYGAIYDGTTSYSTYHGLDDLFLQLDDPSAVIPEPSNLITLGGVLGMGVIGRCWRRRRKRRASR